MPHSSDTDRILRRIQRYATTAILLTALIVTLISIFPLYQRLIGVEKKGVVFARDTSVFIVDEYLSRLKSAAQQITNHAKLTTITTTTQNSVTNTLKNALSNNTHLIGITRVNAHHKIVAQVGKPIPTSLWPKKTSKQQLIHGPIYENNHYYISIETPILTPQHKQVGTDLTLFNITDLQENINQVMLQHPGRTLVSYLKNNEPQVFHPPHTPVSKSLKKGTPLYRAFTDAAINHKRALLTSEIDNATVYIAHAPTNHNTWSVAVLVKKTELIAAVKRTLWTIIIVILVVVIIFIAGLELCLKPISSRILIEQKELEKQIAKSQEKLKQSNEQLKHLVMHDFLTGLNNRRGFNQALEREISLAKRHHQHFALLYIDLNKFKEINDTKGHDAGDAVLTQVANRLVSAIRKGDVVARIGGDEFTVLMPNISQEAKNDLQKKIRHIVSQPIPFGNEVIHCSASVGEAVYPSNGTDAEALMRHADASMYDDKKAQR